MFTNLLWLVVLKCFQGLDLTGDCSFWKRLDFFFIYVPTLSYWAYWKYLGIMGVTCGYLYGGYMLHLLLWYNTPILVCCILEQTQYDTDVTAIAYPAVSHNE